MAPTTPPATTSAQALQNLQAYQGQTQSPDQAVTSAQQSLGVPQAQQQVSGLRQAINNTTTLLNGIPSSVQGRTANSLVTSAQANAQIGNAEAPVNDQLNKEQSDYTDANTNYDQLEQQAEAKANAQLTGQQSQMGYLQSIYNDLYGQESDAAKLAEQSREANLSSGSDDGLGSALASILGGGAQPATPAGSYGLKQANNPGGGYYFRDSSGKPISALQYAQLSGTDYNDLIKKMASSGDSGAQQYLKIGSPTSITGPYSQSTLSLIKAFTG